MWPRYEGANIRSWIGFKHLMYLVEEAILRVLRQRGWGTDFLYREYGIGTQIVDSSALFVRLLQMDDEVAADVLQGQDGQFTVRLAAKRNGTVQTVVKAKARAVLVALSEVPGAEPIPQEMAALLYSNTAAATKSSNRCNLRIQPEDTIELLLKRNGAFYWPWRARYFHCHYSDRLQHSAYIRALEEVVDRFLAERGISVARMLADYGWIPVVSRARLEMLADAYMEETIHTVFRVEEITKRLTYTARMDCFVQRDNMLVHTATAAIVHGYAISSGPEAGCLTTLDPATTIALNAGMES